MIPEERIFALTERLDVRGPRYTSYPTAPVWQADFPVDPYREALARVGEAGRPLAVYMHFPFCRQRCYYCGCNSFICSDADRMDEYTAAMVHEIRAATEVLGPGARHAWLHLGGGTPTHTPADELARVLDFFIERMPGTEDCERSVEVDPRVTTDGHLQLLADRGFRRISMGVQDLRAEVQRAVNREYSYEQLQGFVQRCRDHGFTGVNIDLIYGLPLQSRATWRETLAQIQTLRPDRLACFGYAHLPDKIKHQQMIREDQLPPPRERLGMLLDATRFYTEQGYEVIGLDHFAAPEDSLSVAVREGNLWRNFMGYTSIRGLEMIGFGASAIGELHEMFAQNRPLPEHYRDAVGATGWAVHRGHVMDADDRVRTVLINDLMCNLRVRIPEAAAQVPGLVAQLQAAMAQLEPYVAEGLIEPRDYGFEVTPLGRLFLRNLAMPFDRYLPEQQKKVTFSRTI